MKKLCFLVFLFLFSSNLFSQSIGVSVGYVNYAPSHPGISFGFEYDYHLLESLDLTLYSGVNYFSESDDVKQWEYLEVPLLAGLRYYFVKKLFQPYISVDGGISYINSKKTEVESNIEENFGFTFGTTLGTMYVINNKLKLNANLKLNHNYQLGGFYSFNIGIIYGL